ncbi:thioredoxin family protein [Paenibacillus xerothermodurans]|uniref:thioredoxin family protein n=1 Tax=Paenibacillus xerothermodurans TaxID=1977292 RepID=UPI001FB28AF4|nr:thioredoxin family protein [Paenibacillus xerothermodurans]
MTEWTERELQQWCNEASERTFVYFYTPFCGTCRVAERMLQVILTIKPTLPIVKCNINYCPQVAQNWQIESVPCLVDVEAQSVSRKRYRMQDVNELLAWFQSGTD